MTTITANTETIEATIEKILAPLEAASDAAWKEWDLAKKYGKKAEQAEARAKYEIANAEVVAVWSALGRLKDSLTGKLFS